MAKKQGPERLVSRKISGALENTPANTAILKDGQIKTSLGHWKAKIVESGLFGEMKDGDDPKGFYANLSKKVDEFFKSVFKRLRIHQASKPLLDDGSLNLDFEFDERMAGHFEMEISQMFTTELVDEAMTTYDIGGIVSKIPGARKDKTFGELRRVLKQLIPAEVMKMTVYGKDTLSAELLDSLIPSLCFDINVSAKDELFNGQDEYGNELLGREIPDEDLFHIEDALKDLIRANYTYRDRAREKSLEILSVVFPDRKERERVLGTIGIKE